MSAYDRYEREDERNIDEKEFLVKIPRIMQQIENAIQQRTSPVSPLEKFLNSLEIIFGTKQLPTEPQVTTKNNHPQSK